MKTIQKCPSTLNKWYINAMEYCSVLKGKMFIHGTTWINFKKYHVRPQKKKRLHFTVNIYKKYEKGISRDESETSSCSS